MPPTKYIRLKVYILHRTNLTQTTEVDCFGEETGKTREKSQKWEGTCFTCGRCTKRGFCNAANTWAAGVKRPDQYCENWSAE